MCNDAVDDLGPGAEHVSARPRSPLAPLPDEVNDGEAVITKSVDHIVTVPAGCDGRDVQLPKLVAFGNLLFKLAAE